MNAGQVEWAYTDVLIDLVYADSTRRAVGSGALIDVGLAVLAGEAWRARTLLCGSRCILADSSILTRCLGTSNIFKLATFSGELCRARALKMTTEIAALSTVMTRVSDASVRRCLTILSRHSWRTNTEVVADKAYTEAIVPAGLRSARTVVLFTLWTRPSLLAYTFVRSSHVYALSIVETRAIGTLILFEGTKGTSVSWFADTLEFVGSVSARFGSRLVTLVSGALVDIHLAVNTIKSKSTITMVGGSHVGACRIIVARVFRTMVHEMLAVYSFIPIRAFTLVAIDLVMAFGVVVTWGGGTLVDVDVAVFSGPSWFAEALA